jgi:hypothetical protein
MSSTAAGSVRARVRAGGRAGESTGGRAGDSRSEKRRRAGRHRALAGLVLPEQLRTPRTTVKDERHGWAARQRSHPTYARCSRISSIDSPPLPIAHRYRVNGGEVSLVAESRAAQRALGRTLSALRPLSTAERHTESQQLIVVTGKKGAHADRISNPRTGTTGSRSHGPPGKSHPKPPTRTQPWSRATSALLPPARSSQPTRMAGFGAKVDMVRTHEQQPTRRASLFFAPGRGRAAPRRHTRARS